jgi:hypothetical protein
MTDFVIVAAASLAAALAAPAADPTAATGPANAPTIGFHVYKDAVSCEQAADRLTPPPGKRFVCLPVVPYDALVTAY